MNGIRMKATEAKLIAAARGASEAFGVAFFAIGAGDYRYQNQAKALGSAAAGEGDLIAVCREAWRDLAGVFIVTGQVFYLERAEALRLAVHNHSEATT